MSPLALPINADIGEIHHVHSSESNPLIVGTMNGPVRVGSHERFEYRRDGFGVCGWVHLRKDDHPEIVEARRLNERACAMPHHQLSEDGITQEVHTIRYVGYDLSVTAAVGPTERVTVVTGSETELHQRAKSITDPVAYQGPKPRDWVYGARVASLDTSDQRAAEAAENEGMRQGMDKAFPVYMSYFHMISAQPDDPIVAKEIQRRDDSRDAMREVEQDAESYGTGFAEVKEDGSVVRIDPTKVLMITARGPGKTTRVRVSLESIKDRNMLPIAKDAETVCPYCGVRHGFFSCSADALKKQIAELQSELVHARLTIEESDTSQLRKNLSEQTEARFALAVELREERKKSAALADNVAFLRVAILSCGRTTTNMRDRIASLEAERLALETKANAAVAAYTKLVNLTVSPPMVLMPDGTTAPMVTRADAPKIDPDAPQPKPVLDRYIDAAVPKTTERTDNLFARRHPGRAGL